VTRHRLGFLLVTASALAWSMGGLFSRMIGADTWTMAAWRGLFGAAALALLMPFTGQRMSWQAARSLGWSGWIFVIQGTIGMICYLAALRHTSVANVAVIYATAPFLAAALAWVLMREKPSRGSMLASALALLGVILMVGFGGAGSLLGDLLALVMTAMMASAAVVARNYPAIPILFTSCLASLLSGLVSWPLGRPLAVSSHDLLLLALFGIVNFAFGLPLYTLGARHLPAIETALIGAVDAPLAPLWVWLFFQEIPGLSTLIGGVIVFAAVAIHFVVTEARGHTAAPGLESVRH
jgi:drug/metabolite transporter (DMT)-like permease